MTFGILATDIGAAHTLGDSLRTAAAAYAGASTTAPAGGDMVFGAAAGPISSVPTAARTWRSATHDVVSALALGIEIAADETARADR